MINEMSHLLSIKLQKSTFPTYLTLFCPESVVGPLHQFFLIYQFIPGLQRISHFFFKSFHAIFLMWVSEIRD